MTVYSGVLRGGTLVTTDAQTQSWDRINAVLLAALVAMLILYIFAANFVVSQKYILESSRARFVDLSASVTGAGHSDSSTDIERLLIFAKDSGMIEAKDAAAILDDSGFAFEAGGR